MKNKPRAFHIPMSRRRLLQSLTLATTGLLTRSAFAEALTLTPKQTKGPFFPDKLPLDQDNDLVRISDHLQPSVGTIIQLGGRLLSATGAPIRGALIELWQADDKGNYLHSRGEANPPRNLDFQGYGKFESAADGAYRFRTIKPGLYTGRTRHYHFSVTLPGEINPFVTQLYIAGEPANERDMVLRSISDVAQRNSVIRDVIAIPDSPEFTTSWDIVLGLTPEDASH